MPVLQAAHIKPFSQDNPHAVSNSLFLRSDTHTLFDAGYPTITSKLAIHVRRRVHDDFGNGRIYYAYQGKQLAVVPEDSGNRPAKDYLEWHNDCAYLG
jgi:putative restriction endonuclease